MFSTQRIPTINTMAPNTVLDCGDHHLSYNPSIVDYGSVTTALVLKNTIFLTLNGDHRTPLEKANKQGDLQKCFDYFLDNLHQANRLSNHEEIIRADNTFNVEINARKILGAKNIERLFEAYARLTETNRDPSVTARGLEIQT